jgi:hypothetical protein
MLGLRGGSESRAAPLARISKQRIGTWFGVAGRVAWPGQANWKRSSRPSHHGISTGGSWALRMIGL